MKQKCRIKNAEWKILNQKCHIKYLEKIWNEESRMKVLELKMVKENSQLNNLKWKILYGMYESRACALEFNTGIRKKHELGKVWMYCDQTKLKQLRKKETKSLRE